MILRVANLRKCTYELEHHRHLLESALVDLRDAAFVDAQHSTDFLHRHLIRVVENDHFLIAFGERLHCPAKDILELLAGEIGNMSIDRHGPRCC